jgi:AcrR family transcriptional regulator
VNDQSAPPADISPLQQRVRIVEAAIASFRALPFHEVDVAALAAEAGCSEDEVREHFPHWDGVLLATLDRWSSHRTMPLVPIAQQHGTALFLRALVKANIADPALMRFVTAMLNISAIPDHPLAHTLHSRWRDFHKLVQRSLAHDIEVGREPDTMEPARGAEQIVAMYEGLQLQYMARPRMDLLDSYDRAITRLRDGWSRAYVRPVWDIELVG